MALISSQRMGRRWASSIGAPSLRPVTSSIQASASASAATDEGVLGMFCAIHEVKGDVGGDSDKFWAVAAVK